MQLNSHAVLFRIPLKGRTSEGSGLQKENRSGKSQTTKKIILIVSDALIHIYTFLLTGQDTAPQYQSFKHRYVVSELSVDNLNAYLFIFLLKTCAFTVR